MERLSGWELRQRAEQRGWPVSGKQLATYQEWGLMPERLGGGWVDADVERLVRIRELDGQARSMNRRVILLRDVRWPTPSAKLRQAMLETIPSLTAPKAKMLAVYRALRVRHGEVTVAKAARMAIPTDWRLPDIDSWRQCFGWPTDEEFEQIAGSVDFDAQALMANPIVQRAGFLSEIPLEEVVILLMTRQLTIPPQVFPADDDREDGVQ
jgi:hypothetical protein